MSQLPWFKAFDMRSDEHVAILAPHRATMRSAIDNLVRTESRAAVAAMDHVAVSQATVRCCLGEREAQRGAKP
jgi:hypothetical protein